MPARRPGGGTGGTARRKHSIGNLRRAHPASGATWNVQVVRGKMSSKCLWHACRALILGLTLMLLGAGMATIGYYADQLSTGSEVRGNATVRVKNDLKGFHLNNLSYVGPIVMGFGGFIVVASCVMTFEARDSAAKVVPARFRAGGGSKSTVRSNQSSATSTRRAIGMQLQSSRWDQQFGVFRTSPAEPPPPTSAPFDRDALTAELIKFSKSLSGGRQVKSRGTRISNSLVQRTTRDNTGAAACALLQPPSTNKLYWHAASFDESGRLDKQLTARTPMDMSRRSDTAKRHVLARQKPIEHEEDKSSPLGQRRSSTMSDSSYSGRWTVRCASIASRASSIDSRRIQVDLHSPEIVPKSILRSPKRYSSGPSTTPSVEKEFRSQLSVCSEPPAAIHQLSGQSSLEPCFPEEANDLPDDAKSPTQSANQRALSADSLSVAVQTVSVSSAQIGLQMGDSLTDDEASLKKLNSILKKARPDTLFIVSTTAKQQEADANELNKSLCRSNSSRTFYRPKPHRPKDLDDSIFYIRSAECETVNSNELYDSVQVINERRSTLLRTESDAALSERKTSRISLMQDIPESVTRNASVDVSDENDGRLQTTVLQMEPETIGEPQQPKKNQKQEPKKAT